VSRVVIANSCAPVPARLIRHRGWRRGTTLGASYVDVGGYVVALTAPGSPRLPNGVEAPGAFREGAEVLLGHGFLDDGTVLISPGRCWDPTPRVRAVPVADRPLPSTLAELAGWGPGLTPLGDDLLGGWLAGQALLGARAPLRCVPDPRETTGLSRTLLRHARRGEVAEPLHALLAGGQIGPLLAWGATSGRGWLIGLAAAVQALGVALRPEVPARVNDVVVRLDLPSGALVAHVTVVPPIARALSATSSHHR